MKSQVAIAAAIALTGGIAGSAYAQSSVTLYGNIDVSVGYQSNQTSVGSTSNGHSVVKQNSGIWSGSRFGFKGNEDLGGGNSAQFVLEEGFNGDTGSQSVSGLMFNRQAFVGLANRELGTVTLGRQYTAYFSILAPYSPINWLTGFYGAHPGDIDSLDTNYRVNNSVVYTSPTLGGVTFSGSYGMGETPGSVGNGSTWSFAARYANGPVGVGAGFMRVNNSTVGGGAWGANSALSNNGSQPAVSAINAGYQLAAAQQRFAVLGSYTFSPAWDVSVSYSNVQYIPGVNSKFASEAIFNTGGAVLHYKATPTLDLAAGYSYTRATKANGIADAATYHQFNLSQYYSFSKRTGLYLLEAYQKAKGKTISPTGGIIDATASIGDGQNGAPSATGSQLTLAVGMIHRF